MKNQFDDLAGEAKLRMLRESDSVRPWETLDDTRHCILCEKVITGRQIRIVWNRRNFPRLQCPTRGCASTPAEWVHPENPLVSEAAWRDWVQLLDMLCEEPKPMQESPFRPSHAGLATVSNSGMAG